MPQQTIKVKTTGRINRRDPVDELPVGEVLDRRNFLVEGVNEGSMRNKKMPGSDRYSDGDISNTYTWVTRYYSGQTAKSFAFNHGVLYHIDPSGAETAKVTGLWDHAKPCSETMKVSSNDVMFFADGENGMYSHDGNTGHNWNKESVSLNFVGMLSFLDRMFAFEDDSEDLYFSANLDPTDFTDATDSGQITIGAKRGAKIMAIALLNETLYIFKEDSIWVLLGRSPSEFQVRQVHPSLGFAARGWVVNAQTAILFLGSDYEVYSFGGTHASTKLLTFNLALGGDLSKDLVPLINRNTEAIANVVATFHNYLYRMSFTESGETINKLEYIFNTANQTDALTDGNNVSCYDVWNKPPDKQELITGRSDAGLLMKQNQGLNYDNQAADPAMRYALQTGFIGKSIRNKRFIELWMNAQVLGAHQLPVKLLRDARNAASDQTTNLMDTRGETKTLGIMMTFASQDSVTSKATIPYSNGRGQSLSIKIDETQEGRDISFTDFELNLVVKPQKRSKHVGL